MKLRILFTGLVLGLFLMSVSAQKALQDKLVKQACDHFDQQDFSDLKATQVEEEMTNYFAMLFLSNMEEITEAAGGLDQIEPYMEKLGEDVAVELMVSCPSFQKFAISYAMEDATEEEIRGFVEEDDEAPETKLMDGYFQEISGDRFAMVKVKDQSGKTHQLLWGTYFDGAEALENAANLKGKSIEVSYVEQEYYHAGMKEYLSTKVLTGLRVLE